LFYNRHNRAEPFGRLLAAAADSEASPSAWERALRRVLSARDAAVLAAASADARALVTRGRAALEDGEAAP